jgi:hypothetical protein
VPIQIPAVGSAEMVWNEILSAIRTHDLAGVGDTVVFTGRTELSLPGQTTHVLVHRLA